jgi:hypothetical protein
MEKLILFKTVSFISHPLIQQPETFPIIYTVQVFISRFSTNIPGKRYCPDGGGSAVSVGVMPGSFDSFC